MHLLIFHRILFQKKRAKDKNHLLSRSRRQLIYDSRTKAGLTQQQLADLIHVEKSVIEDIEDADYQDNPLIMLQKIATALNQKVKMSLLS